MADVARLAGVSHQTVSRVINSHPSVRPETRERVRAAMAELNYRPNRLARALVTARSGTIGVLTSGSVRWGPMSTLVAIEEAARMRGLEVQVRSLRGARGGGDARETGDGDCSAAAVGSVPEAAAVEDLAVAVSEALAAFDRQAVEGVVVIAPRLSVVDALADIDSDAPLLLVAAGVGPTARFETVGVDQQAGMRAVARHLIDLGHRQIAYLGGPSDWVDARERRRGFLVELEVAGLRPALEWEGDWTAECGYRVGREAAALRQPPTAVVAANDQMAMGLLRALGELNVEVPAAMSVTGFDDIEGMGFLRPPLTTVRQDFDALAGLAMQRLEPLLGLARADGVTGLGGHGPAGEDLGPVGPGGGDRGPGGAGAVGAAGGGGDPGAGAPSGATARRAVIPELVVRASTAAPRPDGP